MKQLVLPCYKLEMAMSVEAWYFLHGSTDGICNLTYLLSLLSKMTVSEVQSTKRGLGYAVHPGQVDSSMLVLAKEWGIWRKAVSRLLEDFSERGLIRVDSNPVTSIIDMVCVKSWMIAGRLIENPAYRQTIKAYEGVRIFLFNGQQLETLRRSSARKKKEKTTEETSGALLGGIMGFSADDTRIRDSFAIATERGLAYSFTPNETETEVHPNTVDIRMENAAGQVMTVRGESLGGGKVRIVRINSVDVDFTGEYNALIVVQQDKPGVVAHITKILSDRGVNIAFMRLFREEKGHTAYTIVESDERLPEGVDKLLLENPNIHDVMVVQQ